MKIFGILSLGLTLAAAPLLADGHASGDAEAGEKVFKKCSACHMVVSEDETVIMKGGKTGPNLYGLFGRQAGTYPDYRYGDSIVEAGENGLVWNEEEFVAYAADPRAYLREVLDDRRAKSKMAFKLRDDDDAANVWAYLVSVGPAVEAADDAAATE